MLSVATEALTFEFQRGAQAGYTRFTTRRIALQCSVGGHVFDRNEYGGVWQHIQKEDPNTASKSGQQLDGEICGVQV